MNAKQIKSKFSIIGFMATLGLEPVRKTSKYWFYHSPFRKDTNPSFRVDLENEHWKDFGRDRSTGSGDVIDLVQWLNGTDVPGAIAILNRENPSSSFSFQGQNSIGADSANVQIKHIQPIRNQALIEYLQERKIPLHIARKYLKEAYYTTGTGKQYFALSFENDRGGQALRNKLWKGASSPAYFTMIPGKWNDQLNIFEGVFDFLSALVYFKTEVPKLDCLILNSTAHFASFKPLLENYSRINLFLDNDQAGQNTVSLIQGNHKKVVDYSGKIYPQHKDFNEFLTGKPPFNYGDKHHSSTPSLHPEKR